MKHILKFIISIITITTICHIQYTHIWSKTNISCELQSNDNTALSTASYKELWKRRSFINCQWNKKYFVATRKHNTNKQVTGFTINLWGWEEFKDSDVECRCPFKLYFNFCIPILDNFMNECSYKSKEQHY